ncbi:MAG: hypothetical protein ACREDF_05215 [Thermoplasmata archaeon]
MAKVRSWWRLRQLRHRDAVVLAILSASCLLAGEVANSNISGIYVSYIEPYLNDPPVLVLLVVLTLLGFTTYFGGIFVLLGGLHFSWGRVGRGRFLTGLGLGISLLGLTGRLARAVLTTGKPFGSPFVELLPLTTTLTGLGILFGIVSHTLMGRYALMLKKHARRVWRRWRKSRRPSRRSSKT